MIKYINIPLGIVAFSPQRKFGPGLVMLGSVGASLLGTGATIASQAATNSSNKRFAADESEKARQWEAEQWQNRFEQQSDFAYDYSRFQNKQAYDTWLGQQQYNSPAYQAQRMLQAGFNPAAISASPTYGSTGLSPAPASPPSPSVATPPPLMSQAQNPVAVSDIGTFIKDVASATKDNTMLRPMVENLLADTENKHLLNSYQRIENNLKAQKAPAEIQKAFQDVARIKTEIALMKSNKDLYDEQRITELYKQSELAERTVLNYAHARNFDVSTMNLLLEYENFDTLFNKRIQVMNSEINRNQGAAAAGYGAAAESNARATTENALRGLNITLKAGEIENQAAMIESIKQGTESQILNSIWMLLDGHNHSALGTIMSQIKRSRPSLVNQCLEIMRARGVKNPEKYISE